MPTITDSIGVWNQLGTIRPNQFEWKKFPFTATDRNSTFRISFLFFPENRKTNDYLWLRCSYPTANTSPKSLSIKIYPDAFSKILEIPIPRDLLLRNIHFREFEIRSVARSYGLLEQISNYADYWEVKLEELWG